MPMTSDFFVKSNRN